MDVTKAVRLRSFTVETSWLETKPAYRALIAVARKLLHAIYGIFRSGSNYKGTKLFPRITF